MFIFKNIIPSPSLLDLFTVYPKKEYSYNEELHFYLVNAWYSVAGIGPE
jgi:hypothetical protein